MTEERVEKFLTTVTVTAMQLSKATGYHFDELYSAGLVGLAEGLNKWDPGKNGHGYVKQRVKGAMLDLLRSADGLRPFARKGTREDRPRLTSTEGEPDIETMIDLCPNPAQTYERNRGREEFERLLSDPEVVIFRLYFYGDFTRAEIANSLGLHWTSVNQIIQGIGQKIRENGLVERVHGGR